MHIAIWTLTVTNQSMPSEINSNLSEIESLFKVLHNRHTHTSAMPDSLTCKTRYILYKST